MDWVSKSCEFAGCLITFHCTFAAHESIVSLSSAVKRRKIFQYSVSISNCWSSRLTLCNKQCKWIFVFVANPIWYSNGVVVFCSLYISIPELNNSLDAFDYPYDLGLSHWVTATGESHGNSCTNEIILRAVCNTSWYLNKKYNKQRNTDRGHIHLDLLQFMRCRQTLSYGQCKKYPVNWALSMLTWKHLQHEIKPPICIEWNVVAHAKYWTLPWCLRLHLI